MTFVGCALVAGVLSSGVQLSVRGVALGLGAGLGYAIFNVLSFRTLGRTPRLVLMAYTFGISAIAVGLIGIAVHAAFMITPDYSEDDFARLRTYVRNIPPAQFSFTVCTPSPGTDDYAAHGRGPDARPDGSERPDQFGA